MAELRPRVRKQNEHARERSLVEGGEQQARVVEEEANVGEAALLDFGEQLGDAVLEHLAADEAQPRMRRGLGGQVLAGAEADLEPDPIHWGRKERLGRERARGRQRETQAREQPLPERLLAGPQLAAAAAAIDEALLRRRGFGAQKARRNSSTRSSRSHEKPPSGSGLRPKCP